ncbi:mechanosensitive ion channel family protein [Bergeyella sp. RCAD1439]|uniref:mechanosensitive ion channel family protein n=1 Tax=Bergeyella anatis TaxID=3113737 RepID=UPI002E171C56|nr:mechanosensitive ion channel domain-containing protein [Bergeyella sp. RCAD1439]
MEEELQQTQDFLKSISDQIHSFILQNVSDGWLVQVLVKFFLLASLLLALDTVLKLLIGLVFRFFSNEQKYPFPKAVHTSKITHSVAHFMALAFGAFAIRPFFQYRHPETFSFFERLIDLGFVIVLGGLTLRFLTAVKNYYQYKQDFYRIVALNAVSQSLRTFGVFIFSVIVLCVIFGISGTTILGSLGAITAVLVLVFRDTILGFMTGIHVATSRSLKVGDWIGISKYNLEGTIIEINLITTKIQNFDKTISTIPTYDLLSTEIKNLQVMSESNTRRIKRSIYFNIKSFKFLDAELFDKLEKINLIHDYLNEKKQVIQKEREQIVNSDLTINGTQLTNIGVFRIYALNYLKNNSRVDQDGALMVRQLENTPQGMPLEVYCFTNDSSWANYEQIQSDIFDHLLVASKEFDLEIMQVNKV